jgi:crotonobetainyl-CoA:carnitine CoA-transferase CaiB-like acyl-CoA transferase
MASFSESSAFPLAGVRVLSFGSFVAGNIGALILAGLGAEVVKIETKDRPEALRSYAAPEVREVLEPSGVPTTALYAGMTRGLKSISIDMRSTGGQRTFRDLAQRADVVFENLGPGKMEAWDCAYPDLVADNPNLVMVSISGYGRTGPLAAYRAYASNINNYLGLTSAWAPDGIHFDFVAATHAANAVIAALAAVKRGAPGVWIDLAQTEAGGTLMAPLYLDFLANGRAWGCGPNEVPGAMYSGVVRCLGADAWLAIELEEAGDWNTLCAYLDREDLRLADGWPTSAARSLLQSAVEEWAGQMTPLQAAIKLQHVGLAAGPVQDGEDLWRDVQLRARGAFVEVVHPDIGLVEYPGAPHRLGGSSRPSASRGPRLGEHTEAVLGEWLGLGEAEIEALRESGAVWQPSATPVQQPE